MIHLNLEVDIESLVFHKIILRGRLCITNKKKLRTHLRVNLIESKETILNYINLE